MAIKMTIPFDTPSISEEYSHSDYQYREMFEVRLPNGLVAERISKKVRSGTRELFYGGRKFPIQGEGYKRYIVIC